MVLGLKHNETRSRRTNPTGELTAICAAKKKSAELADALMVLCEYHPEIANAFAMLDFKDLPFGCVVAVGRFIASGNVEMWDVKKLTPIERALGNYSPGRFVLRFQDIVALKTPVPVTGRQGCFNLPPEVEAAVRKQLL